MEVLGLVASKDGGSILAGFEVEAEPPEFAVGKAKRKTQNAINFTTNRSERFFGPIEGSICCLSSTGNNLICGEVGEGGEGFHPSKGEEGMVCLLLSHGEVSPTPRDNQALASSSGGRLSGPLVAWRLRLRYMQVNVPYDIDCPLTVKEEDIALPVCVSVVHGGFLGTHFRSSRCLILGDVLQSLGNTITLGLLKGRGYYLYFVGTVQRLWEISVVLKMNRSVMRPRGEQLGKEQYYPIQIIEQDTAKRVLSLRKGGFEKAQSTATVGLQSSAADITHGNTSFDEHEAPIAACPASGLLVFETPTSHRECCHREGGASEAVHLREVDLPHKLLHSGDAESDCFNSNQTIEQALRPPLVPKYLFPPFHCNSRSFLARQSQRVHICPRGQGAQISIQRRPTGWRWELWREMQLLHYAKSNSHKENDGWTQINDGGRDENAAASGYGESEQMGRSHEVRQNAQHTTKKPSITQLREDNYPLIPANPTIKRAKVVFRIPKWSATSDDYHGYQKRKGQKYEDFPPLSPQISPKTLPVHVQPSSIVWASSLQSDSNNAEHGHRSQHEQLPVPLLTQSQTRTCRAQTVDRPRKRSPSCGGFHPRLRPGPLPWRTSSLGHATTTPKASVFYGSVSPGPSPAEAAPQKQKFSLGLSMRKMRNLMRKVFSTGWFKIQTLETKGRKGRKKGDVGVAERRGTTRRRQGHRIRELGCILGRVGRRSRCRWRRGRREEGEGDNTERDGPSESSWDDCTAGSAEKSKSNWVHLRGAYQQSVEGLRIAGRLAYLVGWWETMMN
ncbi:hypothetical protein BDZ91DRAFT_765865 [Kalaharituber pfeilii]|nr:hypothetical protein BDZ91DRAFT_765865 [Kalaharituber pfeilii]